jgi:hypothetical protein
MTSGSFTGAKRLFFSVLFLLLLVPAAYAHVYKTDGNITVFMHVDPNDAPVAGDEARFLVNIQDTQNRFNPTYCNCTLIIQSEGNDIAQIPIITDGSYNNMNFVFPSSGGYILKVIGKPTTPGAFQEFQVTYEYYVKSKLAGAEPSAGNPTRDYFPYIILIAGMLIVIWFFAGRGGKNSKP